MIIYRILAPLDLGQQASHLDYSLLGHSSFQAYRGSIPLMSADWHEMVSHDISNYSSDFPNVFLHQSGFGCLVFDKVYKKPLTAEAAARLLIERRKSHINIPKTDKSKRILGVLRKSFRSQQPKQCRKSLWDTHPYCLGLFFICQEDINLTLEETKKIIAVLCEPSIIDCEDSGCLERELDIDTIVSSIKNLDIRSAESILVDSDISAFCNIYISWAGVVVISNNLEYLEKTLKELTCLEIRLQVGWTMTYYINQWKKVALSQKQSHKDLEFLKWEMHKLLEITDDIIDASMGTRLKKLYEKLIETSGFREERARAERGIELCGDYLSMIADREQRKYRIIIEVLLFVFAFCQAIPLLFKTPIVILNYWLLIPITVLFVILVVIRYSTR